MSAQSIPIINIDVDLQWNSRNPADIETGANHQGESAGIEGLMANLCALGQKTPVDVRSTAPPFYREGCGKSYSLVTGFRRITALTRLHANGNVVPGLAPGHVLAVDHGKLSERDAFLLNARENANRESLAPPDTCLLIKRGLDHGLSRESLALQLGFTPQIVASYGRVAELPAEIFANWRTGGTFHGLTTKKRLGVAEMIAITRAADPFDAYAKAVGRRIVRERRSSHLEKVPRQPNLWVSQSGWGRFPRAWYRAISACS
jgi:hypothetical protein